MRLCSNVRSAENPSGASTAWGVFAFAGTVRPFTTGQSYAYDEGQQIFITGIHAWQIPFLFRRLMQHGHQPGGTERPFKIAANVNHSVAFPIFWCYNDHSGQEIDTIWEGKDK